MEGGASGASAVGRGGVTESISFSGKRKKKESLKDPSRMETRQSRLYHNCMLLDPNGRQVATHTHTHTHTHTYHNCMLLDPNGLLPFDEHLFICP
jgi:predicted amidohydrolase